MDEQNKFSIVICFISCGKTESAKERVSKIRVSS